MKGRVALQTCTIDNYGACLQAYALKHSIDKLGFRCSIINFNRYGKDLRLSPKQVIKHIIIKLYPPQKNKNRRSFLFDSFRTVFLKMRGNPTRSKTKYLSTNKKYNIFVCGSDIVWNPYLRPENLWFDMLAFADDNSTKIAYVPSFGISHFPDEHLEIAKKFIKRFDYLSCREDEGVAILKNQFGVDASHLLDPTLLLSKSEWLKNLNIKKEEILSNYVFLYYFNEFPIDDLINKILLETSLDVYYVNKNNVSKSFMSNPRLHCVYNNAGPIEFTKYILNSKLCICNSLHGLAFSINLNIPFLLFGRGNESDKRNINSRLRSMVKMFNVSNRYNQYNNLENININNYIEMDFTSINKILQKKREESLAFLNKALNDGRKI